MKHREMRAMDYLDWLKEQEEDLLERMGLLDSPPRSVDMMNQLISMGDDLQKIRELKELVRKDEREHDDKKTS